ncbi:hypothetical protein LEP1GSC125_1139 [Leptospira mayottensis 200901122]|uniref:Uncharacterized protein n=1 Tax=Leptospira mayottensis 200901122 TaxID=1193010 RepID=A0AA87MRU1_9LEPT|nr:hypothetical protein LEP1GSC125_1139 [Leptospira mayottensis 200901122]
MFLRKDEYVKKLPKLELMLPYLDSSKNNLNHTTQDMWKIPLLLLLKSKYKIGFFRIT